MLPPSQVRPGPDATSRSPGILALATPESVTHILALFGLLLYIAGLIVTNAYLQRIRVYDFSALNPRFISTGVLWLALTLPYAILALLWLIFTEWLMADSVFIDRLPPAAKGVPSLIALVVYLLFCGYFLTRAESRNVAERIPYIPFIEASLWFFALASLIGYLLFLGYRLTRTRDDESLTWGLLTLTQVKVVQLYPLAVVSFASWVAFGIDIYPQVDPTYGGGRPQSVRLAFTAEFRSQATELGLLRPPSDAISPPLDLLWEGADAYVLSTPGRATNQTIRVSRLVVTAIVTSDSGVPSSAQPSGGSSRSNISGALGLSQPAVGSCVSHGAPGTIRKMTDLPV